MKKNDFKYKFWKKTTSVTTTLVLRQALRKISAQKGKNNCDIFASISPNFYYLLIPQILSELLDRLKIVSKSFHFFSY